MKSKKNSNIEKEMIYVLHLLNEDDSNDYEKLRDMMNKAYVFITNDILDKVTEIVGKNKNIEPGQLVRLNVDQQGKLLQELPNLKLHPVNLTKDGVTISDSTEYIIYSTIKNTNVLLELINNQLSAHSRKIPLISAGIGAGAGVGITVAGWAIVRARLLKQLKKCGDDLVCAEEVKAKIRRLNTIALLSGVGLSRLGSHIATDLYTHSLQNTVIKN